MAGGAQDVTVYGVTPAYRWASLAATELLVALAGLAGFAGLFVTPAAIPLNELRIFAVAFGVGLLVSVPLVWRSARPRTLAISEAGVAYDCSPYTLVTPWTNVRSIVVTGVGGRALALRLERGSVRREDVRRRWINHGQRPWRAPGSAWDRTVPLQPFALGDESDAVLRHIGRLVPKLVARPATRDRALIFRQIAMVPFAIMLSFVVGLLVAQGMIR